MVVGASRLYDWHGSRLNRPPDAPPLALRRTASGASAAPDTLRSRACRGCIISWPGRPVWSHGVVRCIQA